MMAGLSPFIAKLRADPRTAPAAGDVEAATLALDIEGDGNPDAAAIMALLGDIARRPIALSEKLGAMLAVIECDGPIVVRRKILGGEPNE